MGALMGWLPAPPVAAELGPSGTQGAHRTQPPALPAPLHTPSPSPLFARPDTRCPDMQLPHHVPPHARALCRSAATCQAPTPDICSNACVNLKTDVNNCGWATGAAARQLGRLHPSGASCRLLGARVAVPPTPAIPLGEAAASSTQPNLFAALLLACRVCGTQCTGGKTCSNGLCVNPV